jgi:hypothetical protein
MIFWEFGKLTQFQEIKTTREKRDKWTMGRLKDKSGRIDAIG